MLGPWRTAGAFRDAFRGPAPGRGYDQPMHGQPRASGLIRVAGPDGDVAGSAPRRAAWMALARRIDRSPRLMTTATVLPLAMLFLYALAWEIRTRRGVLFDEHLFISVGQGVLSHGYPSEDYRQASGKAFFDHTPLFAYLVAPPAALAGPFGFHAALIAARAVSALFGLATVILAFIVVRDARGTVSGLVASVLVATNPYFVHLSWVIHMEVPMAFFLVLAVYLLLHQRLLWAGIVIAVAVMLKEIALAFWLPAGLYVLARHRWRAALTVTLPSVVAFAAYVLAAFAIDRAEAVNVLQRWLNSASGTRTRSWRVHVTAGRWLRTIALGTVGPPLTGITAIAVLIGTVRRRGMPGVVVVPFLYCALTIVATFLIQLKEERWLTAVIPMAALVAGMAVDWGALAGWLTARDGHAPVASPPS